MTSNRAVIVAAPGKAEIRSIPYPELPGDDYLIVKPTAVAVNPTDYSHVDFDGEHSCEGCIVGCDLAGVVVEVGPGVTRDFKKGDRVAGGASGCNRLRKIDGAFAEYAVVKGDVQMKTPGNLTDAEAATQGVAVVSTGMSLYRDLKLPLPADAANKSFPLFINGGSTAMGIAAIQFAKLSGATVVTTASPANFDYLRSLGADHLVDYRSETLVDAVRHLTNGELKLVYDCSPSLQSGAAAAKMVQDGAEGVKYVSLNYEGLMGFKSVNQSAEVFVPLAYSCFGEPFYLMGHRDAVPEDFEFIKKFTEVAADLLAQGKVKPPRVFLNRGGSGLEGVLHGLDESRAGNVRGGKLVYTLD